jgi:single-stranded DNA-binding protein
MILKQGKQRLCAGRITKDVEIKKINTAKGERSKASIGVAVGENEYANFTAWGSVADYAGTLRKGDNVLICGVEGEPREYNGKTYTDISADYIAIQPTLAAMMEQMFTPSKQTPTQSSKKIDEMQEIPDDLPF